MAAICSRLCPIGSSQQVSANRARAVAQATGLSRLGRSAASASLRRSSAAASPARGLMVRNMFGGMMNKLKGGSSSAPAVASAGEKQFAGDAPSWEDLASILTSKEEELGIDPTVDLENGPPNPLSLKRLFGTTDEPSVTLYRDHAAWCPYCQRVWMQLEEKRIPYKIEKINMRCYGDKPQSFLKKVPSGLLPVLEVDGYVVTESSEIMRILEEIGGDERPLIPQDKAGRDTHDQLMRMERQHFSSWMQWLTSGWGDEQGKRGYIAVLDALDDAIKTSGGPYLMGDDITMVDLMLAPFLERAVASVLYYKGFKVRGAEWPRIDGWFAAMETRPTYLASKSDFFTHCHDLPPQLGGCEGTKAGAPFAAMIDGRAGGTWDLPLPPVGVDSDEPITWIEDDGSAPEHRVRAAAKLVGNHAAVVRFAARGCGKPGARPVMAPLADPTAQPGEEHLPAVDAALRHVAHALLEGTDKAGAGLGAGAGSMAGAPAGMAAAYLRDRVGVPRDMPLQSARQLRAHLNWVISEVAPGAKDAKDIRGW